MSLGTNNNIRAAMPMIGTGTIVGQISIPAGTAYNLQSIPDLVYNAVRTAAVAVPQTPPQYKYPYAMDILAAATGLVLIHNITGYSAGYPIAHDVGAGANPAPIRVSFGDRTGSSTASPLSVKNTTAGAVILNVICYAE